MNSPIAASLNRFIFVARLNKAESPLPRLQGETSRAVVTKYSCCIITPTCLSISEYVRTSYYQLTRLLVWHLLLILREAHTNLPGFSNVLMY